MEWHIWKITIGRKKKGVVKYRREKSGIIPQSLLLQTLPSTAENKMSDEVEEPASRKVRRVGGEQPNQSWLAFKTSRKGKRYQNKIFSVCIYIKNSLNPPLAVACDGNTSLADVEKGHVKKTLVVSQCQYFLLCTLQLRASVSEIH